MKTSFDPHGIEQPLYEEWERAGYFAPHGNGAAYSIAIPPPNVTGALHMGHAFQHTLMDILTRYHRMNGDCTLWQMGTDHAGIATQMLVERQLNTEGLTRHEIGRDAFLDRVWRWREESGDNICQQLRRMGSSVDWSTERFTMDEGFYRAVLEVFVRLHEDGLIYRGKRLVNWDPALETAISDLEVESEEEPGNLWHLRYPLNDGRTGPSGETWLTVATTRPETMLGDTAVAVHPDDPRYRNLVGATVHLPLAGRDIPVIADPYVDPEFGSGCLKITPAHDFNDNEIGERHALPVINVLTGKGAINDNGPIAYRGLDRFEARERIVADLTRLGLVDRIEDHKLQVPRGDRSGAVIEPLLTDQWFVRIAPLAAPAIEAVENGSIEFVPQQYANVYFAWMRNIKDWCISRQQWWGHRIPAWYDDQGNVYVGRDEAEARAKGNLDPSARLTQDEDVLETWFSSSLWTFATLGWPQQTAALARFHPTSTLVTGHDIIFFWVARMIMMTLYFTGEIPFRQVYIHGLVRDADGNKMSKTRGNGLDPLDVVDGVSLADLVEKRTANLTQPQMAPAIEQATRKDYPNGIPAYGTDALRFTYCALASTGRDLKFDLARVEGYRNFCNKLWNARRFVLMNTADADLDGAVELSIADRWIRSRAHALLVASKRAIETCRFDLYAAAVYEFVWSEYCDWYVELTKPVLWDDSASPARVRGARRTLLEVLELLLRATHPVMPFITETIWREVAPRLGNTRPSIMMEAFPDETEVVRDPDADEAVEWLKQVVVAVRNIRGEANLKPAQNIDVLMQGGGVRDRELAAATAGLLQRLARIENLTWLADDETAPANALALVGELKIMVPLAGLIDLDGERERLTKEIERREKELARIHAKLGNENFVAKAPPEVVDKERAKAAEIEGALATLGRQLDSLG